MGTASNSGERGTWRVELNGYDGPFVDPHMNLNHFPIGLPEIIILAVITGGLYFGYRLLFKPS